MRVYLIFIKVCFYFLFFGSIFIDRVKDISGFYSDRIYKDGVYVY